MWWICVLQSGITFIVYCRALYSIKFFINMGNADVDTCYLQQLWVCFCISAVVKSVVITLRCAPATLSDFAHRVSHYPCCGHAAFADAYPSQAGSDPQEARGDTCDRRGTDADVFLSPGSEHFFCSSNWMFSTNVFYNEDVFWAGGNDTCALVQSQLNKLLELCTGIKWVWDSHTPQTMGHIAFSFWCCKSLQNSGILIL